MIKEAINALSKEELLQLFDVAHNRVLRGLLDRAVQLYEREQASLTLGDERKFYVAYSNLAAGKQAVRELQQVLSTLEDVQPS